MEICTDIMSVIRFSQQTGSEHNPCLHQKGLWFCFQNLALDGKIGAHFYYEC